MVVEVELIRGKPAVEAYAKPSALIAVLIVVTRTGSNCRLGESRKKNRDGEEGTYSDFIIGQSGSGSSTGMRLRPQEL